MQYSFQKQECQALYEVLIWQRAPRRLGRHQRGYHIACVDAMSQWQMQSCVQGISKAFLRPVLEMVVEQFPFQVEGFHSDNGSEYINYEVAKMLGKLRIAQTKSRSRDNDDNAPAESKNANVVS